eukprot:SAG31_NODE_1836_length_7126_cov_8.436175_2_plen_457_part_00
MGTVFVGFPAVFSLSGSVATGRLKQRLEADSASILGTCQSFGKMSVGELEPRTHQLVMKMKELEQRKGPSKLLRVLRQQGQSQLPVEADGFRDLFERDGLAVRARDMLCKALEAYVGQTRSPEVELCYRVNYEAAQCAHYALPQNDPRHVTDWQRRMLSGEAGLKIKSFGTNSEQSLLAATMAMFSGVCAQDCDESEIADVRNVYFELLSAMKMLNATTEELEEVVAEARLLDGGAANWKDAYAIHVQLPNIHQANFWQPADFPWLEEIRAKYSDIRDELDRYLKFIGTGPFASQPASARLEAGPKQWNSLLLTAAEGGLCSEHFPITCAAVGFNRRPALQKKNFKWPSKTPHSYQRMEPPGLQVHIYQLMPGGRVLPHRGVFCRLVAALGLRVPDTGAPITVGGETRNFTEGEFVVFDDAWEHDVVNPSLDEPRYVLTTMMLHPECCRGCAAAVE